MKKLQTVSHYNDQDLKAILDSQQEIRSYRDWQIIYSVQTNPGKKAEEIAGILGIRKSKVLRNKSGIARHTKKAVMLQKQHHGLYLLMEKYF